MELELYVYFATNEYNFEVLKDPPDYDPTHCARCGDVINLGREAFSIHFNDDEETHTYICDRCFEPPA